MFDTTDILPEYFYISVQLFNDRDRLEKEIDEWLHVMKYDKIPETYHSPYMAQVAEKLSILKMTRDERANYSYYQKKKPLKLLAYLWQPLNNFLCIDEVFIMNFVQK